MKKIPILTLLIIVSLFLTNCNSKSTQSEKPTEFDTLMVEFSSMYGTKSNLQSTAEILIQSGIEYDSKLTIDTLIKAQYFNTLESSALMLGVFSADALYHSAFGNSDKAFESYTSAQVMANHLGIGPYYVENLLKRQESGLSEADSILYKFDFVLAKFDTNLSDDKRFRIIASYLIGNIIEKLYIIDQGVGTLEGMKVSEITTQARFLFDLLISEKKSIDLFVDILDRYAKDRSNSFHIEMLTLQVLYAELIDKGIPDYKPEDIYLPTEEMKNISSQIEKVRNLIIVEDD